MLFIRRCGWLRSSSPHGIHAASEQRYGILQIAIAALLEAFLSLAVSAASLPPNPLPGYFTRVLDTENGLPQNSVTSVLQTRDGYLWIGTYNGLARFDGATFTVFSGEKDTSPGLRNSRIVSLFEDADGTLWIGHETGELTRYKDGRFQSVDFRVPWENRRILSMGTDHSGKLWLLMDQGRLASIDGDSLSVPNVDTGTRLTSMVRNSRGQIWIASAGRLFALTNSQLISIGGDDEGPGGYVTGIAAALDDMLWVVSGDRIRKWDGQQLVSDLGPTAWAQHSISTAVETRSGALAIGTLGNGVFLLFPGKGVLHFDRSNGFPHDWTRCLFEDREGTLWAGTGSGGLVALRAGKVRTIVPPDQWLERDVLSVSTTSDGGLWVGTEGGGIYHYFNDRWAHFNEYQGLSNTFVWAVAPDSRDRLWAGTWGGGVYVRNNGGFVPAPGLENTTVPTPALLHETNGVTWIGSGQGLIRYENGTTLQIGRSEGLNFPDVRCVVEDGEGGVWFGMMGGGLGHWRDGKLRQFHQAQGLTSEYVQCLRRDVEGTLWVGTYGGGVNRLKHDQIRAVTVAEGLPNNVICHIEADDEDHLWFSSRGGIFRVSRDELNRCADGEIQRVRCLSYGKADGMPTLECTGGSQPAGCRTADGNLWFPTTKGLVVINPREAKVNQLPPPVLIESLEIEGQSVVLPKNREKSLQIPPGNQRFEFRYTALTFVATEKVRFRYRMVGLGEDWKEVGNQRVANYSYLPPGSYTFQVIACNGDGVWNPIGATLALTVQPHFWQSWWFVLLEILAAATFLVLTVLVIVRRRMKLKVERLERQRAIERERARIAQDIHDNLGASLTRISLLSQSAHSELHDPQHAAIQLERIYSTTRELTRAMDEIVWAVNPQHDTLDSLANYLGKFAQDFLGPLQIRCRLDVPVDLPHWPVTAEVRHNLFLAVKEALHNVVKHAGASEVTVALATAANRFTFAIRDNGRGFAPDSPAASAEGRIAGGNGLLNMRARLEKVGGCAEVETAPGNGTTVKLTVPVAVSAR